MLCLDCVNMSRYTAWCLSHFFSYHSTVLIQRSDEDVWKNEDMLALDVRNLINDVSAQLNLKQKCSDGHCVTKHW